MSISAYLMKGRSQCRKPWFEVRCLFGWFTVEEKKSFRKWWRRRLQKSPKCCKWIFLTWRSRWFINTEPSGMERLETFLEKGQTLSEKKKYLAGGWTNHLSVTSTNQSNGGGALPPVEPVAKVKLSQLKVERKHFSIRKNLQLHSLLVWQRDELWCNWCYSGYATSLAWINGTTQPSFQFTQWPLAVLQLRTPQWPILFLPL